MNITQPDALLGAGAVAGVPSLEARIEVMRASGMLELALRRARHTGPTMMEVVEAVARASGLDRKDLFGCRRTRRLARARQLAMFLVRDLCPGASLHAIGHLLNRDHTTVLYGCRRAASLLERDEVFRQRREEARRYLAPTTPGRVEP